MFTDFIFSSRLEFSESILFALESGDSGGITGTATGAGPCTAASLLFTIDSAKSALDDFVIFEMFAKFKGISGRLGQQGASQKQKILILLVSTGLMFIFRADFIGGTTGLVLVFKLFTFASFCMNWLVQGSTLGVELTATAAGVLLAFTLEIDVEALLLFLETSITAILVAVE